MVKYESHNHAAPAAPVLPCQKFKYIYKLEMAMVHYNVYLLKFNSLNKYIHLKLIILDCMVNFYRSKGLTATALNFSILRHTFTRS